MIYHVTTKQQWEAALRKGCYEAPSLASEGFIHMSRQQQVAGVLQRYYQNTPDLLLLHINETKLTAELKFELAPSVNEEFPHLYGPLNLEAVAGVAEIK